MYNYQKLTPGTIISVPKTVIKHVGIVTDKYWDGHPTIIANTPQYGKVVEQTLSEFCEGYDFEVLSVPNNYRLGIQAVYKAYSLLNKSYNLFTYNCEHLISEAYSLKPQSPQLQQWSLALFLGAGIFLTLTKTK